MLASEIALQLAPLIGYTSLTPQASSLNGPIISDGDKAAMAIAITQALQEIFALGPTSISEQLYGDALRPPVNVTFTATQYSATISAFATWASWMEGCTIQGGDGEDNMLLSATELDRPYMAGSQSGVNATVYADALKLQDWVKNTMDPVWTPRIPQLRAASNREEFRFYNSPYIGDSGHRHSSARGAYYTSRNKTVGEPSVYFVEPRYDPNTGALPLFMRFNPMPGQAYPITFRVKRKPPIVTAANITGEDVVMVTGDISPDATGTYNKIADGFNGAPIYARDDSAYVLFLTPSQWELQAFAGGLVPQDDRWFFNTSSAPVAPSGTYAALGVYTGAPSVTASNGTSLVIPTDWHESILLPFAKKWLLSHPNFSNPSAASMIMQQYQIAKQTLESFIPQISPVRGEYH